MYGREPRLSFICLRESLPPRKLYSYKNMADQQIRIVSPIFLPLSGLTSMFSYHGWRISKSSRFKLKSKDKMSIQFILKLNI